MTDREQIRRDERLIRDALSYGLNRLGSDGPSRIPFVDAGYALDRFKAELEEAEQKIESVEEIAGRLLLRAEQAERERDTIRASHNDERTEYFRIAERLKAALESVQDQLMQAERERDEARAELKELERAWSEDDLAWREKLARTRKP